jgi:hypothetical protein
LEAGSEKELTKEAKAVWEEKYRDEDGIVRKPDDKAPKHE